jgi:glyoxylase-like metal-dependent hydrolase (beta-lactamase superfamily II)
MGGVSLGAYTIATDSGSSLEIGKTFRRELEKAFILPIRHLFLTHTHTDHRMGMDAFQDTTLIASQRCIENMPRSVKLSRWSANSFSDKLVLRDDDISVEFRLVAGHSVGSSIAYVPEEKVLFGGDLFVAGRANYGLPVMHFYQNRPKRTGNPDEYITAYKMIQGMDVDVIVPGHGDIVTSAQEYLKQQISFFEALRSFIISALGEGRTLEEIQLPRLAPIEQAYVKAEKQSQKSRALRWLKHYLELLKLSLYNHYAAVHA